MYCRNHADLPATARCAGCAESFCDDCVVELAGQKYCGACKVMALGGRSLIVERAARPCKDAGLALTLSIVGLFFCGAILEIIAIVYAFKAKNQIAVEPQLTGSGKVTAALIIAFSGLVLGVLNIVQRVQSMNTTF